MENESRVYNFQHKVWVTIAIAALFILVIWIIKVAFNVLLLVLAGALIALYFRRLANFLNRKLKLPKKLSLPVAIVGSFIFLGLFIWLAGSKISAQAAELTQTLPSMIHHAKGELVKSPIGNQLLERLSLDGGSHKSSSFIQTFFRSSFGVLSDIYVVLFLSLFFTVAPKMYTSGFVRLLPTDARPKASAILDKVGDTLAKWLKGKIFSMLVVAVLTAIGLLIIGMPMAFVLALIAGILNFIPNFGPLIALIPAVLVGLMQSADTALLVAGLYILVQVLESNVITPQIQKRLISIPPALIIIAQLMMGFLTGGWGVLLATPIIAIVMVLVQELWIKKQEADSRSSRR